MEARSCLRREVCSAPRVCCTTTPIVIPYASKPPTSTREDVHNSSSVAAWKLHPATFFLHHQAIAMHFALPPRKTSHPPPYARPYRSSTIRRRQLQKGAVLASTAILIIYLLTRLVSSSPGRPPAGVPEVVLVTVLDRARMSDAYITKIMENRDDYAARHGKSQSYVPCPTIIRRARTQQVDVRPQATRPSTPTQQPTTSAARPPAGR